jgi:uncharacterized protein (TIGR00255 family)
MVRSMTAYSRVGIATPFGEWTLEIHSVNRKTLDMNINLPRELLCFDIDIRKWMSEVLSRGQVTVRLHSSLEGSLQGSSATLSLLLHFWEKIATELGYDPKKEIHLPFLVQEMRALPQKISEEQEREIADALRQGVKTALDLLCQMKEVEGGALQRDMEMRVHLIETSLDKVSARAPELIHKNREKMRQKIQEISTLTTDIERHLVQEIALLAERTDITEEIIRLRSHIDQFFGQLKEAKKSLGRTLDFLLQEMQREMNTMAAKSQDMTITQEVVNMKSELEKIREQVQNVE